VTLAMASGVRAALAINQYLVGEDINILTSRVLV
jgi:hypothetical protein